MNHRKNPNKRTSKRASKRHGTTWRFGRAVARAKTRKADLLTALKAATTKKEKPPRQLFPWLYD